MKITARYVVFSLFAGLFTQGLNGQGLENSADASPGGIESVNGSPFWSLNGNSNVGSAHFLGTTNSTTLSFKTNNKLRMRLFAWGGLEIDNGNQDGGGTISQLKLGAVGGGGTPTGGLSQNIRTRHSSSAKDGNAIDFYTWQPSDGPSGLGSLFGMTLNGGMVGIGTTSPVSQLHVVGAITAGPHGFPAAAGGSITFRPPDGQAFFHIDNGPAGGRPTGRLRFSYGNQPGDFEVMTVNEDGNVGIGTNTPSAPLDVNGAGAGLAGVTLHVGNSDPAGIGVWSTTSSSDANLVVTNTGTGDLIRGFSGSSGGTLQFQVLNNGTTVTRVLQITGGADIAEPFDFSDQDTPSPGSVVVIDEKNPGHLRVSEVPYDKRVAGVVSGAGGIQPGVTLQSDTPGSESRLVALNGRVYVLASAQNGSIKPGDFMTTSSLRGHAMKATDQSLTHGAVIGKAMSGLELGEGLVLVLVNLQ